MTEFFQGECGHNLLGLVAIVVVCGGPFLVAAWALWLRHRRNEILAELKRDMIEKGMSADEIVRVLNAGPPPGRRI
jgi:hypothetical protein